MVFMERLLYLGAFIGIQLLVIADGVKYSVMTTAEYPFTIVKKSQYGGNDKYEGFILDLLKEIDIRSTEMEFEVYLLPDTPYDTRDDNGNWNRMIRHLVRNDFDIAAAAFSVTAERADVVKLSHPILRGDLRIIVKWPKSENRILQRAIVLLHPFGTGVWIAIAISFITVSFVLYVIGRLNPTQEANEIYENTQMVTAAFCIMSKVLFLQDSRLTRSSIAGRILACFWRLFVVITIAVYVSGLGFFLFLTSTAAVKPLPFYSFEQLANQEQFQYGILKHSFYYNYFKYAEGTIEKKSAHTSKTMRMICFIKWRRG